MSKLIIKIFNLIALTTFCITLGQSCRDCDDPKNPDCSNFDPCLITHRSDAAFEIVDSIESDLNPIAFPIDTFVTPIPRIYFRAKNKNNESYEWKVGTDARTFTKPVFTLFFDKGITGNIPVRLITKSKPQPQCFPNDDGIDTVFQNLFLYDGEAIRDKMPILGSYKGYNEDQKDSLFTIKIVLHNFDMGIYNLPRGCSPEQKGVPVPIISSWRNFVAEGYEGCEFLKATGSLQADGKTMIIDYSTQVNSGAPRIKRKFVGTKQ